MVTHDIAVHHLNLNSRGSRRTNTVTTQNKVAVQNVYPAKYNTLQIFGKGFFNTSARIQEVSNRLKKLNDCKCSAHRQTTHPLFSLHCWKRHSQRILLLYIRDLLSFYLDQPISILKICQSLYKAGTIL